MPSVFIVIISTANAEVRVVGTLLQHIGPGTIFTYCFYLLVITIVSLMLNHVYSVLSFIAFEISFYQTWLLLKVFVMDHKDAYEGQEVEKEENNQLDHKISERIPFLLVQEDFWVPNPTHQITSTKSHECNYQNTDFKLESWRIDIKIAYFYLEPINEIGNTCA